MTRRQILAMTGAAPAWLPATSLAAAPAAKLRMGGAPTAFSARMRAARQAGQPFDIIEHCHSIGLGGVQTGLPATDADALKKFRQRLEAYNMHFVGGARLPRQESDVPAFDAQVKAYKEAGALALHVPLTGRRYEVFDTLEAFKKHWEQCQKMVSLAEPVLRKHQIKLAIENHKDWRFAEHIAWLKRLGSEWVGVCVDTGNNIALCEDSTELAEAYAPYAVFCHIKDMAVDEYEQGFLLDEVPMGEGLLDLPKIVGILRRANPNIIIDLEMITRDPLKIPVLTDKYWVTFDNSYSPLPGRDLARTLAMVRAKRSKTPLPQLSQLSLEEQVKAEDANNLKCIAYARRYLDL